MAAPQFSADDYLRAMQSLMPRGRVWPRDPDAVQTKVLRGLSAVYVRTNARANNVLAEAFPPTTYELLPEWEATLGLPDTCSGTVQTVIQRRGQVVARFIGMAGQRISDYVGWAAQLGFSITVTNCAPFRMGQSRMGAPLGGPDWSHTWRINAPLDSIIPFRMGGSAMGDPLQAWGNAVLECEMEAVSPPHTILQFSYT